MSYLALILMGAASVVGYLQSEKAKERRKSREKLEGRKMAKTLQFGSLKLMISRDDLDGLRDGLAIRDKVNFRLREPNGEIVGYKNNAPIGLVDRKYHKFTLLQQAIQEGKSIVANVNKLHLKGSAAPQFVSITFEVS